MDFTNENRSKVLIMRFGDQRGAGPEAGTRHPMGPILGSRRRRNSGAAAAALDDARLERGRHRDQGRAHGLGGDHA